MGEVREVALIGAGYIAGVHAEALALVPGIRMTAVVDPVAGRARALAARWSIPAVHESVPALMAAGAPAAAHVLVPPPLHRAVAEPLLRAGVHVLLEKPMAAGAEDCVALQEAAAAGGAALEVNQNFIHHRAHRALKDWLTAGRAGPLRHVVSIFSMPLHQLGAGQLGHWMFARPVNLLLEQAVHPLSQIDDLIGPIDKVEAVAWPPRRVGGIEVHDRWTLTLASGGRTAQLHVELGASLPVWTLTAVCEDGVLTADLVRDLAGLQRPTRWIDPVDTLAGVLGGAWRTAWQGVRNGTAYTLSTAGLARRGDPFFRSMAAGIGAFHEGLRAGGLPARGGLGRRMVEVCEAAARWAPGGDEPRRRPAPAARTGAGADVLVIGGTGFIGRPTVAALLETGQRVAVLARGTANLPPLYEDPGVTVIAGSAGDPAALGAAMAGVPKVVNLAHAGGALTDAAIDEAIVGGAEVLARTAIEAGVARLVHVSTIAALYLGDPRAVVTGASTPDDRPGREAYSRAKARAELALKGWRERAGLPVVVLRPGFVVGEGGSAFPLGVGFYYRPTHCLGWNRGTNPLPFVLVEDVAGAILAALEVSGIEGRSYNVVGGVRLSARQYTEELAAALGRPLRYHPQSLARQQAVEIAKWAVKRGAGRTDARLPSMADLRSRGAAARFDTADIERDLGWTPVRNREEFIRRGIAIHGRPDA
jgi:predicted dehydrogenase/nucleoside-diphosphate-sugar epimerase